MGQFEDEREHPEQCRNRMEEARREAGHKRSKAQKPNTRTYFLPPGK